MHLHPLHVASLLAGLLFVAKQPDALTAMHRRHREHSQASEDLKEAYELTQQFVTMIRKRQADHFDGRLELDRPGLGVA